MSFSQMERLKSREETKSKVIHRKTFRVSDWSVLFTVYSLLYMCHAQTHEGALCTHRKQHNTQGGVYAISILFQVRTSAKKKSRNSKVKAGRRKI